MNQRIVVVEDRDKRLDLFKGWFDAEHDLCGAKTVRAGIEFLIEKPADVLFLDFDLHDAGDAPLREWLGVRGKRELDGLDVVTFLTAQKKHLPKNIVIHSRNPMGRLMLRDKLKSAGVASHLWAFDYKWRKS